MRDARIQDISSLNTFYISNFASSLVNLQNLQLLCGITELPGTIFNCPGCVGLHVLFHVYALFIIVLPSLLLPSLSFSLSS